MVQSGADIASVRTLAAALAAEGRWMPDRALRYVQQVATQLTALHAQGQIHRTLSIETLAVDLNSHATIAAPTQQCSIGEVKAHEWTHPVLRNLVPFLLPTNLVAAHEKLRQAGVDLDPREIDVYQLNAILCRLLTNDCLDTYLRSPRAKAKVPIAIRQLLDRAGSRRPQDRIRSMEELSAALRESLRLQTGGDQANARSDEAKPQLPGVSYQTEADRDTSGIISPSQLLPDTSITQSPSLNPSGSPQPLPADGQDEQSGRPHSAIIPSRDKPTSTDALPFQKLGHYQILDRIGCGGMGDVYRGYEQSLDRVVAIKVLPAELERQEEFVRRFRAEATAAARLVHPNIIQIYFIGEDSSHHFFAMQFVDGESLADLLVRRGKLKVDEAVGVISQVLAGLAMAHKLGMVHRDIKPANILLDRVHNRALVADFGLVKSTSSTGGKTATGVVMGTVDYIAPEQARAQAIDSRADLYSLGVMMYHMLTGKLPFEGDSPTAILFQHVYDVPKRVDEISQDVPTPLASVVARLLEKSPDQRYQTAEEVLIDLRAFREGHPLPGLAQARARPRSGRQTAVLTLPWFEELRPVPQAAVEPPANGWWARMRQNAYSLFRAQAPGLLASLLNTQQQFDGAIAEYERRRDELQRLATEAKEILAEFETQAKAYRFASERKNAAIDLALQAEISSELSDSVVELDRIAEALERQAVEQREQLEAMAVRLAQVNATLNQLKSQRAILAARLSAAEAQLKLAGRKLVGRRRRGWIIASGLMLAGLGMVALAFIPGVQERLREYTPDSIKPIVFTTDRKSSHGQSGAPIHANLTAAELTQLSWAESGSKFALTCLFDDGTIRISRIHKYDKEFRAGAGETISTLHKKARTLAAAPDGDHLAIAGDDSSIHIWSIKEKREVRQLQGGFSGVDAMKFSSDSSKLLAAARDGVVCLWDVQHETELKRLPLDFVRTWVNDLSWSADEHRFLVGANTHNTRNLSVWSLDSDQEVLVVDAPGPSATTQKVLLGPEPYALSLANQKVHLWNIRTGKELVVFGEKLRQAAFSHDARSVLTMGNDRIVNLWNARTGQLVKTLGTVEDIMAKLVISTDGRFGVAIGTHGELQTWTLPLPPVEGQIARFDSTSPIQTVACSPDGIAVAYASHSNLQFIQNPEHWHSTHSHTMDGPVSSVSFSADAQRLLYGTGMVKAKTNWMGVRGTVDYNRDVRRFRVGGGRIVTSVYLPDASRVISASEDGSVAIWSAQGEQELSRIDLGLRLNGIALLPSGTQMLVAADDNDIRQWSLDKRQEIRRLKGHTFHVSSVAVDEDGRIAVSGGKDRSVRTWDIATGTPLKRFAGHTGYVNSVAISADGQVALSGSDDTTVRLWDTLNGEELRTFDGHLAPVRAVHISPDGNRGISGSDDGTVRVWDLRIRVSEDSTTPDGTSASIKNKAQP